MLKVKTKIAKIMKIKILNRKMFGKKNNSITNSFVSYVSNVSSNNKNNKRKINSNKFTYTSKRKIKLTFQNVRVKNI